MSNNLTIGWLRRALRDTIGQDLMKEGFVIDNKTIKAKKKIDQKNSITIFFDCYDYKPVKLEFRLLFSFLIFELNEETKKYFKYCNEEYLGQTSFVLSEGDFHPKVKYLEPKLRNAATHIVSDGQSIEEGIEDCRRILSEEIIPQLTKFSILKEFQQFVLHDYESVLRLGLVIPGLIAAKMHSRETLIKMVDYMWIKLELESKSDLHIMKKLVGNIIGYLDEGSSLAK